MAAPTIKLGHVDPAEWQSSKKGAAGQIFKNIVEGETGITVELFPAKALGDENDLVQQVQEGTTHMAIVSAAMAKICKPADVLNIPYTFASPTIAWDVLDGPFGKELADLLPGKNRYPHPGIRRNRLPELHQQCPRDQISRRYERPQIQGSAHPSLRRDGQGPWRGTHPDRLVRAPQCTVNRRG